LSNPIVAAALIGVVMAALSLNCPACWIGAVQRGAASAVPVPWSLLARPWPCGIPTPLPRRVHPPVLAAAFAKLVALPILTWLAIGLTEAPPTFRLGATLLAATPTAVNVFIQTRALGVFARGGARTVALTTALSVLTLSIVAILLTKSVS